MANDILTAIYFAGAVMMLMASLELIQRVFWQFRLGLAGTKSYSMLLGTFILIMAIGLDQTWWFLIRISALGDLRHELWFVPHITKTMVIVGVLFYLRGYRKTYGDEGFFWPSLVCLTAFVGSVVVFQDTGW